MLWVTRHNPHVDRCSSAWLIKRFIDKKARFAFVSKDDSIPRGAIAFTLPKAEIKPVEKKKTTYDVLVERYGIQDPIALKIGKFIHDFEIDAGSTVSEFMDVITTHFKATSDVAKHMVVSAPDQDATAPIDSETEKEIVIELPMPKGEWRRIAFLEAQAKEFERLKSPVAEDIRIVLEKFRETRTIKIEGKNVDDLDLEKLGNLIEQANEKSSEISLKGLFKILKR